MSPPMPPALVRSVVPFTSTVLQTPPAPVSNSISQRLVAIPPRQQSGHSARQIIPNVPTPRQQASPQQATALHLQQQFRSKTVCKLTCTYCDNLLCLRGMKAILLADTRVELYSTDCPPSDCVQMVNDDYVTRNCRCRIRDVACLGCGNVAGYHVTQPCEPCLASCNNGHFWMYHSDGIRAMERSHAPGAGPLMWSQIGSVEQDRVDVAVSVEVVCR